MTRSLIALVPLMAATAAVAATPPADVRNFVACPIVQDTATVPCWTARSGGETYYLGIQSDIGGEWYPPQLNHQVLVEGKVSKEPRSVTRTAPMTTKM